MTSSASKEWKACLRRRGFRRYRCCCCTGAVRSGTCAPPAFPQDIQHRTVVVPKFVPGFRHEDTRRYRRSGYQENWSGLTIRDCSSGFFFFFPPQQVSPIKGRGGMDGGKQVSETDCVFLFFFVLFLFCLGARQRTAVKNLMMRLV